MYVHKNHIRSWVIHTFNLKRLERENIGGSSTAIKRICNQDENISSEEICEIKSKRPKTTFDDNKCKKRMPKPVRRYDTTELDNESSNISPKER